MSSLTILEAVAPQYVGDSRATTFLSLAGNRISAEFFGERYDEAVAWLTAHMLTMADREAAERAAGGAGASSGAIQSKSAGDLSIGFGGAMGSVGRMNPEDAALTSTSYGLEYLRIRNTRSDAGPYLITVE